MSGAHAMDHAPAVRERDAGDRRFELIALLAFAACVSLVSLLHEPWNDETQSWRLAIDSDGVGALIRNARYEGHPVLFHLLLQALGQLSRSWWAAVALHVVIACAAAWVVLRYAPFNRLEKALVVAGYFPAYEYAVIVRPYGLTLLLAFGACAAWSATHRRPLLAAILLILLANTTALGLLVALAAGAAFVIDLVWLDDAPARFTGRRVAIAAVLLVLLGTAAAIAALQVIPPADAAYRGEGVLAGNLSGWNFGAALTTPLRALTPVARIEDGSVHWNLWLFRPAGRLAMAVQVLLSAAVVAAGCLITMRRRTALLLYLAGTLGLVAFFALVLVGSARHHGHIVIVWIMAVWLSRAGPPTDWPAMVRPLADRARRWAPRLFVVSLVPMVVAAAEFMAGDALRPFSDARNVATFLRARSLDTVPLLGISRADAQAVSALLDRPVIYPLDGRVGTFLIWGTVVNAAPSPGQIVAVTDSLLQRHCEVVLLSTRYMDVPPSLTPDMRMIYETPAQPMSVSRFRVWQQSAPPSSRCPGAR
jgi:hypothetical protein